MRLHDALVALATSTVIMAIILALIGGLVYRTSTPGEHRRNLMRFLLLMGLMMVAYNSGGNLKDTPSARFEGMWAGIGLILVSPAFLLMRVPKHQTILAILAMLMFGMAFLVPGLVPAGYWPASMPTSLAVDARWACYVCCALFFCVSVLLRRRDGVIPAEAQG